jgi:hypothetical protein
MSGGADGSLRDRDGDQEEENGCGSKYAVDLIHLWGLSFV